MMDKLERRYIILVTILILLISITGTFAWYVFQSNNNAIVNTNVCAPEILFIGGDTINGSKLVPVSSKEDGLMKNIQVNLNNTCNNDTVNLNLKMKLSTFPSALASSSFVWELYKNGVSTAIASGNFAGKQEGNVISLANNEPITENLSTYSLYIYIDGNLDNSSSMGGQTFNFKIYGEGVSAINTKYYMANVNNSSSTTSFWGTPINANQVRSISFVSNNDLPDDVPLANAVDVSLTANSGDVIVYYKENGTTTGTNPITLYDVYVTSINGYVYANKSSYKLFAYLNNCISIDLNGLDTSNVTDMSYMFRSSSKLTSLDLSSFDTSKVLTMTSMFNGCTSMTSINVSSFDTSKVGNMSEMFRDCSKLTSIDGLNSFTSPSTTTIGYMFYNCQLIERLDLSGFDTSIVNSMTKTFYNCKKLTTIYVSDSWTIDAVTSGNETFYNCLVLEGQNNTSYISSNISYSYAVVDTSETPGYLTLKTS